MGECWEGQNINPTIYLMIYQLDYIPGSGKRSLLLPQRSDLLWSLLILCPTGRVSSPLEPLSFVVTALCSVNRKESFSLRTEKQPT
jgi:hypothetical protein